MNNKIWGIIALVILGAWALAKGKTTKPAPVGGKVTSLRPPPCGNYGDIDGDGYITSKDATLVKQYLAELAGGITTLTAEQLLRADVDGNGKVNIFDILDIDQYAAGQIDTFLVCAVTLPPPTPPIAPPPPGASPSLNLVDVKFEIRRHCKKWQRGEGVEVCLEYSSREYDPYLVLTNLGPDIDFSVNIKAQIDLKRTFHEDSVSMDKYKSGETVTYKPYTIRQMNLENFPYPSFYVLVTLTSDVGNKVERVFNFDIGR